MTDLNRLLKGTARSLYLSARLLPTSMRDTFCVAYLLCRYADTIADTALLPAEKRLHWVSLFPACVEKEDAHVLDGLAAEIAPSQQNIHEKELLQNLPLCLQAYQKIPAPQKEAVLQVVRAVCDGMEIDLRTFPNEKSGQIKAFETPAELENYCHLMGGAPGLFWSKLLVQTQAVTYHPNIFLPLGQDIGDALQIVNILRDLPRDLRIGRCYIASDDLVEEGIIASDLLKPQFAPQFEPVKRKWIGWARQKLASAQRYFEGISLKQPANRAAVAWPVLWAADTLNLLEQEKNLLDPAVRVKISRARVYGTMLLTPPLLLSSELFGLCLKHKLYGEK